MKKILLLSILFVAFQGFGQTINSWIITPNGGEAYQQGDVLPISLGIVPTSGPTYAWLLKSGTIVAHLPTFTGYNLNWTIPNNIPSGTDYKIRVADINNIYAWDESDAEFTIGSFEVIEPTCTTQVSPNHFLMSHRMINVQWTGASSGTVTIELYHNGTYHTTLANQAPNSGSFSVDSQLINGVGGSGFDWQVKVTQNDSGIFAFSCGFLILHI